MSAPESQTSADQALSSFMGAAIGAPDNDFAPNQPTTDERQIARWKRDSELLDAIQSACWDVRFISHSNGDDYSIGIEIVSHFMQRPCERVIGENWNENLRAALEQAMTAEAYPPARPERSAPAAGDARGAAVGAAIERACAELPFGYSIELFVEAGYGGARLADPDDGEIDLDQDERDLAKEINAGIDAAIAAQQGKGDGA